MRSIAIPFLFACLVPAIAHGDPALPSPAAAVEASPTPTTRLYVRTLPPGAQVMLDGKPLGASDGLFLVPAGTAKVSVQFDGKDPQVRQVEIAEGRITRVEIQRDAAGQAVSGIGVIGGGGFGGPISDAFNHTWQLRSSRKLESPPAPLTKFDEILEKPFDVELQETPLRDAARLIGEKAGLNISFDRRALEDAGLDLDTPVTASVSGAPLARGLDIVCRPMDLTWTVEDDGLQITTAERAAERLFVHVHDVSDLCEGDLSVLIELIQRSIAVETWDVVGGPASIHPDTSEAGTFLVVSQSLAWQRQIQRFLECLRRLKATPPAERATIASDGYWGVTLPTVQARTALEKPLAITFEETPLQAALSQMSKKAGVPIAIDSRAIEDAGIDAEAPVAIAPATLPLARLLERLLTPLDLTFDIIDDRITITTKAKAAETLSVAIYPADRLVGSGRKSRSFQSLVELIQRSIEPQTWDNVGGPAGILPLDGDVPCLVIRQTTAGHRAVEAFLRSLK